MPEPKTLLIGGPWFEDFAVGQVFDAPAVTITDGHASLLQSLTGDRLRLPLDHAAAVRVTRSDQPLAHPLLAINIAIGQSTWASQRVKANLFYRGLVLQRPVHLGDTLTTVTQVVALKQNKTQPGRAATGVVALEMSTHNQRGEAVLHFWRCPMIPCRDPEAATGHADDLARIGTDVDEAAVRAVLPAWDIASVSSQWQGRKAADIEPGTRFVVEARDSVTCAPELVRATLNMAMAHTDAKLSYLGDRLVYGGHTISIAFAQVTRALPNLCTILAWDGCDHTAPVVENDRLRSEVSVLEKHSLPQGALLRLRVETWAARGAPETEERVLDWRFWAWSA